MTATGRQVGFWHIADIICRAEHVCFQVVSGRPEDVPRWRSLVECTVDGAQVRGRTSGPAIFNGSRCRSGRSV